MHKVENYILCVTNNRNNSTHHWFEEKNSNFQYRRRKYWRKKWENNWKQEKKIIFVYKILKKNTYLHKNNPTNVEIKDQPNKYNKFNNRK